MSVIYRKYVFFIFLLASVLFYTVGAQKIERISNKEGFNQNTINDIEQDLYGFLWFGTPNGLIRYDGYEFKTYTTQTKTEGEILSNYITSLYNDANGILWIGSNLGLNVYIPWLEKFYNVPLLNNLSISNISMGPKGRIWVSGKNHLHACEVLEFEKGIIKVSKNILESHPDGTVINDFSFNSDETLILATSVGLKKLLLTDNVLEKESELPVMVDFEAFKGQSISAILNSNDIFWIGTNDNILKVTLDGDRAHIIKDFKAIENGKSINLKSGVNAILEEQSGIIWIGTTEGGLYKYSQEKDDLEHFEYNPKNEFGLSSHRINTLFQDDFNVLWIGTAQGGINKLDLTQKAFKTYSHNPYDEYSISDNLITSILEDKNGKLWISGYNAPLSRSINVVNDKNIDNLKFENLKNKLPIDYDDIIRCIYEDSHGYIWFGADSSLIIYNPNSRKFKKINLQKSGNYLNMTGIWSITEIDKNKILLAGNRIIVLENPWKDFENNFYTKLEVTSLLNLGSERVHSVFINDKDSFWIGSNTGLSHIIYDRKQIIIDKKYKVNNSNEIRLSYKNIFSLHKENNNLWIGTFGGGLNKMVLDEKGKPIKIEYFRKNDILPDDAIYGILQEDDSHLWLSTDMGLVKFNIKSKDVKVYDVRDGLAQNNFRMGSFFKGESGYFYFGGLNGLTIFKPEDIKENTQAPEILISGLVVNNKTVRIGENIDGKVLLEKSISETDSIEISQNERIISFNLAVKHTSVPSKNKLAYKLEGFNNDWIELNEGKATVTYTNLSAGEYVFKVKAANGDGVWSTFDRRLNLKILPPWYNTWWSYLIFFLLAIGIGVGIVIYFVQHERLKQGLKYEKIDKERIETINQGKLRYFTNLSHEFRTPLTLIAGPLERIITNNSDPNNTKYLSIVQKNTKRLLSLVDQLITFRQAEQGRINLNLVKSNLGDFIYPTTEAFENYALEKNINFFYKVINPNEEIVIDIEKVERIIFNLLSNSFKNTPQHGTVSIEAGIEKAEYKNWIRIDVIDNGKGIPPENIDNIFERFYQLGNKKGDISGGGIGLSFCKSLVNLLEGEIYAKSKPSVETRFTVKIPSKNIETHDIDKINISEKSYIKDWVPLSNNIKEEKNNFAGAKSQKQFSILVVENEQDVLNFLYNELSSKYNVNIANNGLEAYDKIKIKEPDLIISDVMMPEMDGFELCEKIKSNSETCHIPVLLLTALGENENVIKGLEFGADEYISKPFSIKHLELRVIKLIQNSIQIRRHFSKNSALPKDNKKLELSKRDQAFIENIIQVIEKNLSDSNFGVEELSTEIGLSTSHFYRRLKQLTGQVPNVYIRNFRLQRAAEILQSNEGFNVAEVMYQIGIESNSYFSTSFKKLHGVSPSEFLK